MSEFKVHSVETAPEDSQPLLEAVHKSYGFLPHLMGVFAESPAVLEAYTALSKTIQEKTAFSPVEQQVILLAVSRENSCEYCVSAHSAIADMVKMPDDTLAALREGQSIADPRLEALRTFTLTVVRDRGWVSEEAINAFLDAGFEQRHVLEVFLGIALKTISNYTNHIAETPLDKHFAGHAWSAEPAA